MTGRMVRAFAVLAVLLMLSATAVTAPVKVLHLLTALDPNEAKIYIGAFEKSTGAKVEWVRMSAGECLARLRAESRNPQFSVWFGGPSSEYVPAGQAGVLEPFRPEGSDFLSPQQKDADWNWVGFYFGALGGRR